VESDFLMVAAMGNLPVVYVFVECFNFNDKATEQRQYLCFCGKDCPAEGILFC
jgi:hypothetical protein